VPPAPIAPQASTLRLKEPIGVAAKPRAARPQAPAGDIYSAPARPDPAATGSRGFPWKLAAAAAVVLAIGGAAAGGYIPGRSSPTAAAPAPKPAPAPTTAPAAAPPVRSIAANTGRIEIETQPAGAKVLVDGKPAGESPLALDAIPAGRHTLTFISTAGSVRRTIRVEAGKTLKVDVPIFSGWVGIFAPIVLEVAEDGRSIGTTEESRLMLAPGRHELTLTNRELGYTSIQTVDIEPGEVRSLTIDPRGSVNFNATPWAEVWIDGKKVGETPLANLPVTLGVREIVFKNQQFGERRVTITVKANEPAAVSIDMSKQ
jgi:hypothetical protein